MVSMVDFCIRSWLRRRKKDELDQNPDNASLKYSIISKQSRKYRLLLPKYYWCHSYYG